MDLGLTNQVAVVTGGSRGLGRAICLSLAGEGARVAINYRRAEQQARHLAAQIEADFGVKTLAVQGDVSRLADIQAIFAAAERELGPIDVLVNNAGVWPTAYVKDMTEEQWNSTIHLNLTGPFLTCREVIRRWLATGRRGRIVNVASQAAFHGSTSGHADYAAAKAGLVAFTVSLAREVAANGIRVNAVAPGMMTTDMAREVLEQDTARYLERIPLRRIANPAEVADVVAFLVSDRTSYMTGATVDVTGGMLMR